MTGSYYRDRIAAAQRDAENALAARLLALDEALTAVRTQDDEVLDAEDLAALNQAQAVVNDLRRTW